MIGFTIFSETMIRFSTLEHFSTHVQKVLRDAYWKYVSNVFTFENDSSDPDTPKPEKIKKFWSFV